MKVHDSAATPTGLLAVGDVHGEYVQLQKALAFARAERRHAVLLGDLIGLGLGARRCVQLVCEAREAGVQTTLLRGNHEQALLDFLNGGSVARYAMRGGMASVSSYVRPGYADVRAALVAAMPTGHREVLEQSRWYFELPNILLSHSGPDPSSPWLRDSSIFTRSYPQLFHLRHDLPFVAIFGHYRKKIVYSRHNAICLDTGCGSGGPLSACLYPELQLVSW